MGLLVWLFFIFVLERTASKNVEVWSVSQEAKAINNRPIIGILTEDSDDPFGDEAIMSTYVEYLESAGARVVPIQGQQPTEYYESIFNKINGVLFPGGSVNITEGNYYNSGKLMYDFALKANDQGDYFPIWGTCLGFELLTYLTAGNVVLSATDSDNLTLPLNFTEGFQSSRLFQDMSETLVKQLMSEPLTQNNHIYSVLVEDFAASENLRTFYQVMSTNVGRDKLEFVSTLEAFNYPIYATQWHPEKNAFQWDPEQTVDHSYDAVQVTQYMADFFVNEARKSSHHYDSTDDEAEAVIENYLRLYDAEDDNFDSVYYFNFTLDSPKKD